MKINEVIERHGMQLRDVSREMGMKPSALQSAIDRNLTVKTLRQISEAARIPIAEFFLDELTDGERQQLLAALQPSAQPSQQPAAGTEQEQKDDTLPFGQQQRTAISQQAIICPHCHSALVFKIEAYGESK
jgi:lambda repressor-like predicted transcriptional regulator